jgi:YteA family regulatory protein
MRKKQLNVFAQRLRQEKAALLHEINLLEKTGLAESMPDSISELSMYDNHPADLGDAIFERSKDTALRGNELLLLERVEHALAKIDAGTYGICDRCRQPIDISRLQALPMAALCIECQKEEDIPDTTPRPLEEEVLAPPFGRTFLDSSPVNSVGFDGEDALQAVMFFGSSDTPQDLPGSEHYENVWPNSDEHPGLVELTDAIPSAASLKQNTNLQKRNLVSSKETGA